MCVREYRRAFTLGELIIVLVCMGLLGGLAAGGFRNLLQTGREEAAAGRARLLNAARFSYALAVPGASARWEACGSDVERFALLAEAHLVEGEAGDYLVSPGGYSLVLGGKVRAKTLVEKQGRQIPYR